MNIINNYITRIMYRSNNVQNVWKKRSETSSAMGCRYVKANNKYLYGKRIPSGVLKKYINKSNYLFFIDANNL